MRFITQSHSHEWRALSHQNDTKSFTIYIHLLVHKWHPWYPQWGWQGSCEHGIRNANVKNKNGRLCMANEDSVCGWLNCGNPNEICLCTLQVGTVICFQPIKYGKADGRVSLLFRLHYIENVRGSQSNPLIITMLYKFSFSRLAWKTLLLALKT